MALEDTLTGENLAFYRNIQDLKALTAKAKALITRSHAMFNDIVEGDQLRTRATGADLEDEDRSYKSMQGECPHCGLTHGAHDFCIVQELITVEKKYRESPKKSVVAGVYYQEAAEEGQDVSATIQPAPETPPREEPPREKVKEWENLLYREMTPEALDAEYSKICFRYGVATGKKFLRARSLARERNAVRPLFTDESRQIHRLERCKGKSKIASLTRDCVQQKKPAFPGLCPQLSPDLSEKMATVLDLELPCEVQTPKLKKVWKSILKERETIVDVRKTIEDDYSHSSTRARIFSSSLGGCSCVLEACDCGAQPLCDPPKKNCLTLPDCQNNYLITIRERLRKRRLLAGQIPKEYHHQVLQSPSKRASHDFLRRDSEMMMKRSYALRQKDLKNCLASAIEKNDIELDRNVTKIAEIASVFTKPDERAWDKWIERFHAQDEIEEEGISGDSDIPTSHRSSASSSSTERELKNPQPSKRIPFVRESLRLVDVLFDKIFARFRKSIQKSSMTNKFNLYKKRFFFSHVDNLMAMEYSETIRREIIDKLNLHCLYLKSLKPKKVIMAERLKRLKAKSNRLSKIIRRRNYIEGVQVGKHYRRCRKSMNFTKEREFIGFNQVDRNLLQKPTPKRFDACDLVGDDSGVLLSKKRIHYHYRLLRALFNGTTECKDRESLMDEGMKERLQNFKKTLHNSSWRQFVNETDTEDEDVNMLKAASISIQSPSKRDEKKLKSAPGYFPCEARSNRDSRELCSWLNDCGNESSLFEGTYPSLDKTSSHKSPKRITSRSRPEHPGVQSRVLTSDATSSNPLNRWGGNRNRLLAESFAKTSKNSSQRLSSEQTAHPTRSNQTYTLTRAFNEKPNVSKDRSDSHSFTHWESYRLPTPPLSESSCDEFDSIQHRVPPKEEAHIEKSSRLDARGREKCTKENMSIPGLHFYERQNLQTLDESELTDKSSDSYVAKLLKIPLKRTFASPGSSINFDQRQQRTAYHKTVRVRARVRSSYLSDSSSTDTEPVNPSRWKERPAWDHKSGLNGKVAPYLDTQTPRHIEPPSRLCESHMTRRNVKSTFMSPRPKAGPSILKSSSLPKPPCDETCETQSKVQVEGMDPVKRQSFSDSSSLPNEGLIKTAWVVTEHLLKAPRGTVEADLPASSSKKYSVQSRATPSLSESEASKKRSEGALQGVPKSGQVETVDGDEPVRQHVSLSLKPSKVSSTSHRAKDLSPKVSSSHAAVPDQIHHADSLTGASSSKRLSKRASKLVSEVFRHRSLAPSEQSEKREPPKKTKASKKGALEDMSLQNLSDTSMQVKLKKLAAVGPTKKRCFNLDIGQGINCVNYLKENAPGADEIKKKELVDLLVTQVEVRKAPKKAAPPIEKEISVESSVARSLQCAQESKSSSLMGAITSSKVTKVQAQSIRDDTTPLRKTSFKTLDQIYKEVHGINQRNTPRKLVENDYEYEAKKRQQLTKHKITP